MGKRDLSRGLGIWILLGLCATAATADDVSQATKLFREGQQALKEKRFDEACALFEKSLELESIARRRGVLASCYEKLERPASAWLEWRKVADEAKQGGPDAPDADKRKQMEEVARDRMDKLEPRLVRVKLAVSAPIQNLSISLDGRLIEDLDESVPLDPGDHVVAARAPGFVDWHQTIPVEGGAGGGITLVTIGPLVPIKTEPKRATPPPEPAPPVTRPAETPPAVPPPAAPQAEGGRPGGGLRIAGLVVGGVGVVAVGAGVFFGLRTKSLSDGLEEQFVSSDLDSAESAERNMFICYGVGAAAVVTGGVLYILGVRAGKRGAPSTVAVTSRTIALGWSF